MLQRIEIIPGVVHIIPLEDLRETPDVHFHDIPLELVKEISAIDRVEHAVGAYSPVAKDKPDLRAWYMHPHQEDNLLVLNGMRKIELYTVKHGKVENFEAAPNSITHNGKIIAEGPTILGWGTHVFHRVVSPEGSVSMNFARHFEGFSIKENFNIYDLDTTKGAFSVIRLGFLDQPMRDVGE